MNRRAALERMYEVMKKKGAELGLAEGDLVYGYLADHPVAQKAFDLYVSFGDMDESFQEAMEKLSGDHREYVIYVMMYYSYMRDLNTSLDKEDMA